ncbi:hypothetical protein D3C71_828690 [compost metagenome]
MTVRFRPLLAQLLKLGIGVAAVFERTQHAANADFVIDIRRIVLQLPRALLPRAIGTRHHILDHLHQPHLHAVVGVIDALHAIGLQLADFLRSDGATTAAEHLDVAGAPLAEHVHHVLEVLDMPALVRRQRNRVGVFLQRRAHHVLDAAVVAQVDHLRALRLDQAAHDVDGRIVAVKQAGGGDKTQRSGFWLRLRELGGGGTHGPCNIRFLLQPIIEPRAREVRLQRSVTF